LSRVDDIIAMHTGVRGDDREGSLLVNGLLGLLSYCRDLEAAAGRERSLLVNELLGLLSYCLDLEAAAGDYEFEWEKVFDAVFQGGVCKRACAIAHKLNTILDYYDPDTTYQEDAQAFIRGLEELCRRLI
jgi:hypothetical protein